MRTTEEAVAAVLQGDYDPAQSLAGFIETANAIVTAVCQPLGYTDEYLELIERWLSAHFYCIPNPQMEHEGIGAARESPQQKVDLNLLQTRYGQQAVAMDYKGGLRDINRTDRRRGHITWMGTPRGDPAWNESPYGEWV